MATADEVSALLERTSLPATLARTLVGTAPDLWLSSGTAAVLASDLVLVHPALATDEVRAAVTIAHDRRSWRLTVAAHDRSGLLADTAALVAERGMNVAGASVATWAEPDIALHALTLPAPLPSPPLLQALGASLRRVVAGREPAPSPSFRTVAGATVDCVGVVRERSLLAVTASDQVGLLWAMCRWLADRGCSIDAAWLSTTAGEAHDLLAVRGEPDCAAMAAYLNGEVAAVAVDA